MTENVPLVRIQIVGDVPASGLHMQRVIDLMQELIALKVSHVHFDIGVGDVTSECPICHTSMKEHQRGGGGADD